MGKERTESCTTCKFYNKKHNEEPCKSCFGVRAGKLYCYKNFKKIKEKKK